MKSSFPLFLAAVLLFGCNTISTQKDEPTTSELSTQNDDTQTWLDVANTTESLDVFITAANNIIWQEDLESYQKINNGDLVLRLLNANITQVGRGKVATFNRLKLMSDSLGSVCGSIVDSNWILLRTRLSADRTLAFMDYRIEYDDVNTWCTLTVERIDDAFKITDLHNHYFHFGLADFVSGFIELDANEQIEFPINRSGNKTIYTEIEKGLAAFDAYLRQASADTSLPLVNRIRLDLIDDLTDPEVKQSALSYFVKPNGSSKMFPIQQVFADLDFAVSDEQLLRSVKTAEDITGDRSTIRSMVANYLMANNEHDRAKFYIQTAIMAEPTNSDPYFALFDWYLAKQEFNSAVQTLQVLVENFDYTFEREDFLDSELYQELIEQPVFNAWLPKA